MGGGGTKLELRKARGIMDGGESPEGNDLSFETKKHRDEFGRDSLIQGKLGTKRLQGYYCTEFPSQLQTPVIQ